MLPRPDALLDTTMGEHYQFILWKTIQFLSKTTITSTSYMWMCQNQ